MTVVENSIRIDTTPDKVWSVLASRDALAKYDPGVSKAVIVSAAKEGPGAARRCDLTRGGWFKKRVEDWRPNEALSFELYECSLPVRSLGHSYTRVVPISTSYGDVDQTVAGVPGRLLSSRRSATISCRPPVAQTTRIHLFSPLPTRPQPTPLEKPEATVIVVQVGVVPWVFGF